MTDMDFLFFIAQVAATIAGFSTLVVAVRQDPHKAHGTLVTARLIRMLQQSLIAVLFCFVPFLPRYAGLSTVHAWQISSGLFFAAWIIYYVHSLQQFRREGVLNHLSRSNRLHFFGVHPMAMVVLALGGLGVWGNNVGLMYLCCTLTLLYLCGFLFLQQVRAISVDNGVA